MLEISVQAARRLPLGVYPVLAMLAAMQVFDPGTLQRIASQPIGRGLLGALAVLLLVASLCVFARVLTRSRVGLEPDASDALLHMALALAGLGNIVGSDWLPVSVVTLLVGFSGLALAGAGLHLLSRSLLRRTGPHVELAARDLGVRGSVALVLGAFLFATAARTTPAGAFASTTTPWDVGLLVATTVALVGYGLHLAWQLREEAKLWERCA